MTKPPKKPPEAPDAAVPASPPPPPRSPTDGTPVVLDRPITPKELANYLKVSVITIKRAVQRGDLPHFRIGARVRFIPSEVIRHLRNKK